MRSFFASLFRFSRRCIAGALLVSALLVSALTSPAPADESLAKTTVTIETSHGPARFTVEVADTEQRRENGLMYRTSLAPDAGMLFEFGTPQQVSFWMKNTLIPLDMLFIGVDGHIANIAERTVPLSEAAIPSAGPVVSVIELNGGTADRLGITPGERVEGATNPSSALP